MRQLVRLAEALGRATAWWVPSAFAIAVLLTLFTMGLALTWGGASFPAVVKSWGDGFWELLTFSMQMALVMFTGYLLALTEPVKWALERIAGLARSPRSAVVLMALASMLLAYINWGLSIVASAMLVRFVVRRQPQVDYRLLVACAYFGLGATWHSGLSASAPLLVATPKHFLEDRLGIIPITQTLFSPFNLALLVSVIALLTFLAYAMHPSPERAVTIDPALLDRADPAPAKVATGGFTLAGWLDQARALNWIFGGLGACWIALTFWRAALSAPATEALEAGALLTAAQHMLVGMLRQLNINTVNFIFLTLAVLLHRSPAALLHAAEEAAGVLSGIVLQFPLYAGIYGIFKFTGLTEKIGDLFLLFSSQRTFPAIVYWYSGLVNYFVPSGGSKWAIEAPYLLTAAKDLGVPPEKVVLAYAWGDMATDLIQPFWALPLLSVARLEFKDILGFLLLACLIYVPLVTVAFLLFA